MQTAKVEESKGKDGKVENGGAAVVAKAGQSAGQSQPVKAGQAVSNGSNGAGAAVKSDTAATAAPAVAKKARRPRREATYTEEDFIRAWQTSESTSEVAKKLNIEALDASHHGSTLRHNGVALQKFTKRPRKDYDALNRLAASLKKA